MTLGNLIENWHISDFHISRARPEQESGYAEHLSREGENLSLVTGYLHSRHPKTFLVLLYDPDPHPLLCVEQPENQLYPTLLWELAEEFRAYAERGSK